MIVYVFVLFAKLSWQPLTIKKFANHYFSTLCAKTDNLSVFLFAGNAQFLVFLVAYDMQHGARMRGRSQ